MKNLTEPGQLKRQRIYEQLRDGYGVQDILVMDGIAEDETRAEIDALRRCGLIHRFYQIHGIGRSENVLFRRAEHSG